MSTDVQTLLQQNRQGVAQAAGDYVRAMDASEVMRYLHAAATNAIYSDDGDAAWVIRNIVNSPHAYGNYLKNMASMLLRDRPAMLKYFPPDFTKGVASRVT